MSGGPKRGSEQEAAPTHEEIQARPGCGSGGGGGTVAALTRIALDGGGSVLVEAPSALDGPVKAGRLGDTVHDVPQTLQGALEPVTRTAGRGRPAASVPEPRPP